MQSKTGKDEAILVAVAGMTADIASAPKGVDVRRLRFLVASAFKLQQQVERYIPRPASPIARLLPVEYGDDVRETMQTHLREAETYYAKEPQALEVHRRDIRESLLEGSLVDSLSGLSPDEQLGPFIIADGSEIWFDVFFVARRLTVIESGASAPALVFTKAGSPVTGSGSTTIKIEAGTVWIRGDLVDGSLPAGAFVGVKVSGGSMKITGTATVSDDTVKVGSTLRGELDIEPAEDDTAPTEKGCTSSGAKIDLPESLRFRFGPTGTRARGLIGKAQVWGQDFEFPRSKGTWFFVKPLWTVILDYQVKPDKLETASTPKDLVEYDGTAGIYRGGLGLPVVIPTSPAILGEVARAPGWCLAVKDFTARWYETDARFHTIDDALVGISDRGVVICAEKIQPLNMPVAHAYKLWSILDGGGHRVLWRQTYQQSFGLFHSCDTVLGEYLLVGGKSDVALDRPVQSNGTPIATPTDQGLMLLHRLGERVNALFGAEVRHNGEILQLVLRNALVWTTRPLLVFAYGRLERPERIDAGAALLFFGVHAWTPILPDPYVSNFQIHRPDVGSGSRARSLLVAKVSWTSPEDVGVSFYGQLGSPVGAGKQASSGEPRPAPGRQEGYGIGPTQVNQGQLYQDEEASAGWDKARDEEARNRKKRLKQSQDQNRRIQQSIDGYLVESLGSAPQILLLDVSTNQDLLGVAFGDRRPGLYNAAGAPTGTPGAFQVSRLEVRSQIANLRVVTLPQVQWEPVRTLDVDQDILTLGWFPTPLASATDGGATQLGAQSQRLVPHIPQDALLGTYDAYSDGTPVVFRTTLPFGLVAVVRLLPEDDGTRDADLYELTRPEFPGENSVGGLHVTAIAEGGRSDTGGISPTFKGQMYQLINGVDLASGAPLGLSVLGSTGDPDSNVEAIFNDDMLDDPRVPVTRFDLSGYGGSNFSDWNDPFAAFAQTAKVQFRLMGGRTALEVIKVNSVIHLWGIRVTRSITVERRPGGGVIRRDSGWQPFTPGLFDYRYIAKPAEVLTVADYTFDAGIFQGLFNVRSIRPAPGSAFCYGTAKMVPYYFDADLKLEGLSELIPAIGVLGYLQVKPNGEPAAVEALQNLLETQGPIGGPIDAWIDFGGSRLPYRARRIEVGLALDGADPVFVATVRGVPTLPQTGAWCVVKRPVASVPPGGGEATPVSEDRGVPLIRRYPISYPVDTTVFTSPPLYGGSSAIGDYRFADAADLLVPDTPANDYALLQSTPTHAFLFPRPYVSSSNTSRIRSHASPALADFFARSTSKGAFPPPQNTIRLGAGSLYFNVGSDGSLALSSPIQIVNHPTPLRLAGSEGHGTALAYDKATLCLDLQANRWSADFTGLQIWTDIVGMKQLSGSELHVVGSTDQRPQIATISSLVHEDVEKIMLYIPLFGARGSQGPIDLGASNAKHEFMVEIKEMATIPPPLVYIPVGPELYLKLYLKQSTGFDKATGGSKASATFGAALDGKIPVYSVGVVEVILVVIVSVEFTLESVSGSVTSEKLDLMAFLGVGVKGTVGPFRAYAYLGIGFVMSYSVTDDEAKYGGIVAFEAGVSVMRIVEIMLRAELKGLFYEKDGKDQCDYTGKVKLEVEIFFIFSISASYQISDTVTV